MNKKIFIFFWILFFFVGVGNLSGQNVEIENNSPVEEGNPVARPEKPYFLPDAEIFKKEVEDLIAAEKEISNDVEKRYDRNEDGKFQEEELKAFLGDVVFVVERRTWINVNSPLLKIFDLDKDGRINLQESFEIKKFLRQENP